MTFRPPLLPGQPRSALVSLDGLESQLLSHFGIALSAGLIETPLRDLITCLHARIGPEASDRAAEILDRVWDSARPAADTTNEEKESA